MKSYLFYCNLCYCNLTCPCTLFAVFPSQLCNLCMITGAIEVSIATMYKRDRLQTEEVYTVGFVPSYDLPDRRPNSIDPFLEPLIKDLEDGFIEGKMLIIFNLISIMHVCQQVLSTSLHWAVLWCLSIEIIICSYSKLQDTRLNTVEQY